MGGILEEILAVQRREILSRKLQTPHDQLIDRAAERERPLLSTALEQDGLNVIAEIKYRSPSHGAFLCQLSPEAIAEGYRQAGAVALSILTEERFFGGRLDNLLTVYRALRSSEESNSEERREPIPLLRKDFLIEDYQVAEAAAYGASAYLLIVACLSPGKLHNLLSSGQEFGMEALVEVHDAFELDIAMETGAKLIGVNNRDLKTFEVTLNTSFDLARRLEGERGFQLVSESGISERSQMMELKDAGFSGFLIGTSFMKSEQPGRSLSQLLGQSG